PGFGDKPYIIKSLLRRAMVLEALWLRLIAESLNAPSDRIRASLTRQANSINAQLLDVQGALHKVTSDLGIAESLPSIIAMADADLPEGTTSLERVRAGDEADSIYEDEFGEPG